MPTTTTTTTAKPTTTTTTTVAPTTTTTTVVKMTSFDLNQTEISGKVGDTVTVKLSNETPSNATDKTVNVGITDSSIATPSADGDTYSFKLLKAGTTQAHWVSADGGAKADLNVTVTEA